MLFEGDKVYIFIAVPLFAFSWLDDKNKFLAGDKAAVRIIVLGNFDSQGNASLEKSSFKPSLIINEKVGNSCYISGVVLETSGDTSNWRIIFTPILVGLFNLLVLDEPFKVLDSSLHFYVDPGIYIVFEIDFSEWEFHFRIIPVNGICFMSFSG